MEMANVPDGDDESGESVKTDGDPVSVRALGAAVMKASAKASLFSRPIRRKNA